MGTLSIQHGSLQFGIPLFSAGCSLYLIVLADGRLRLFKDSLARQAVLLWALYCHVDAALAGDDGLSEWGILWRIIMPLSRPAIAVVVLFRFLGTWNDFLGPLIYLRDEAQYPLALMIFRLQQTATSTGTSALAYPHLMAVSTIVALPVVIAFILAQRTFIEGISMTGLKG